MRLARSAAIVAAVLTTVCSAGAALGDDRDTRRAAVEIVLDDRGLRAAGVGFTAVERERGDTDLSLPGTVVVPPSQLRVVAAPVDGLIEAVEVAPDELVDTGQTILRMRSPELVLAQREFISADADATLAADRLRRAQALFAARALPERDLRTTENEAKTTSYKADERMHALKLMGMTEGEIETLRRTRDFQPSIAIVAPKPGYVVTRYTSPGARVTAAEPLFTIAQVDPLWINIQVPTSRLGSIALGSTVSLTAQGVSGKIIRLGRSVDGATQSVTAVAEVSSNNGAVRPGLAVTVRVNVARNGEPQWVVPSASVVRHRDRSWIFVSSPNGVRAVPVEVVAENGRDASIKAELTADDKVASRGVIALLAELAKLSTE